jgi:hypothetical protein
MHRHPERYRDPVIPGLKAGSVKSHIHNSQHEKDEQGSPGYCTTDKSHSKHQRQLRHIPRHQQRLKDPGTDESAARSVKSHIHIDQYSKTHQQRPDKGVTTTL